MKATALEATLELTEAAVERQELRFEEAKVDTIGLLQGRYGDQHLVERRRRQRKMRTRNWPLPAEERAVPALRKIHIRYRPGEVSTVRNAPKRMRFAKGRRTPQTSDLKEQLQLRMVRTSHRIFRKMIKLKMVTRIVRFAT
jgi:hypothetical protein